MSENKNKSIYKFWEAKLMSCKNSELESLRLEINLDNEANDVVKDVLNRQINQRLGLVHLNKELSDKTKKLLKYKNETLHYLAEAVSEHPLGYSYDDAEAIKQTTLNNSKKRSSYSSFTK